MGIRHGGRAKGTPNRKTQSLMQICEEMGLEPFVEMILAMQQVHEPKERFRMAAEICQYLYPKRKAVEHSTEEGKGFKIVIEDYKKPENG